MTIIGLAVIFAAVMVLFALNLNMNTTLIKIDSKMFEMYKEVEKTRNEVGLMLDEFDPRRYDHGNRKSR